MQTPKPVTMVMVDDNADEIFLTRRSVRGHGIINHFVSERKSENLIETIVELRRDANYRNILVLLDINMPRADGFQILSLIRQHAKISHTPVIMFSSSNDEADIDTAARLGADAYMVKPFTMEAFVVALGGLPTMHYQLMQ